MKKGLLVALIVVGALIVGGFMTIGGIYNGLVSREEAVTSAWAQVENVYQRRLDLVPNLVETVKGYAAHERETLQAVVEARSKVSQMTVSPEMLSDPAKLQLFQQAQGALSSALSRLMVVVERYPDLKASQNFLALQTQLEGTENRIAVERRRFNEAARAFNTFRRSFPNVFLANLMGFQQKAYFEAEQGAAATPKVQF
ncbi:MAG: LemA family protein [Candidatus Omnitrophica bacterium CG11_big_fil_rev_8_21_14_0_20_64_10]|nr:MAG: LemA family protein [Candidatus Omnitrophica bacterium CG11_big_fil_rev_8_21_14_0_20_64_10]